MEAILEAETSAPTGLKNESGDPASVPPASSGSPAGDPEFSKDPHEPPGETVDAPQGTRFEKIREAGGRLFEKFGLKRSPGRPPNCLQCGLPGSECPGHPEPNLSPHLFEGPAGVGAPADRPRDPLLVRRSVTAIGKSARKFGDKIVYRKALEATGDKAWAETLKTETSATDEECEALGEVTDLLLKELGLETKYLPLAACLVVVAGAGSRYVITIKDLNKQIAIKRAKENPQK